MNANNFQQFVSSNQGKLITFKHQGSDISKYVVDVCGEYFTCKGRETDAKIDGFYYFSECEMYKPTLIEALTRHRYVVLIGKKSPMCDTFFEYKYCKEANSTLMVIGKQLSATNPDVGYAAPYIGEVWAIVEGKYTKVWEKTNDTLFINGDDLKNIGVRKFDAISEGTKTLDEEEIKKEKVQWYKDTANDWIELCKEEGSIYSDNFISMMTTIKNEPYSKELYDGLCLSYEYLRDSFLRTFKGEFNRPKVQALTKRFLVLTTEFRKKFGNNDSSVNSLVEFVNKEMSVEGGIIYKRKFEDKKASEKEPVGPVSGASGPVKIEYRGKEKTVEIMNECTHKNGKTYIWVRDLSDKGKTKTLFKEYVKYIDGKVNKVDKNGCRVEYTLKDEKIDGEYKKWYRGADGQSNGQLWYQEYYKEGKLEGEYKEWDLQGRLNKHYLYKNNEIVQNLLS